MRTLLTRLAAASLIGVCAAHASAETLYGVDALNGLFVFDSANPAAAVRLPLTGLQAGETLVGIDVRPANGQLYGVGTTNRVYQISTLTGVATATSPDNTAFALNGTRFGFDFNPIPDRIRVVSDAEQSLRLNPDNGALGGTDTSLTPVGNIVGVAYDRNFARGGPPATDPTPTTLFGIDSASGMLVRIGGVDGVPSPNGGAVTNIGLLNIANVDPRVGFDISGVSGTAFLSVANGGFGSTQLYTVDLATGNATLLPGLVGNGGVGAPPALTGLAATVPEPGGIGLLAVGAARLIGRRGRRSAGR